MKNLKAFILFIALIAITTNCTGQLVFSQLFNSRLDVYLMATYESNDPYGPADLYVENNFTALGGDIDTDLADTSSTDLKKYFDIAEIRMAKGAGLASGGDPQDHFEFFARDRELFCSDFDAQEAKTLEGCKDNNGINKLNAFFSGGGYKYPASDVAQGNYQHVAIYFRRMITSKSALYDSGFSKTGDFQASFDNEEVLGSNWEPLYQIAPGSSDTTLLFPLELTDLSLFARDPEEQKKYVLEIRVFLHNLWMKHLYQVTSGSTTTYRTFVGPSDWKADSDWDNTNSNQGELGGNVLMQARMYIPDEVGAIEATGITGTLTNNYFVVVAKSAGFDPTSEMPLAASSITGAGVSTIKNLPAGNYDVYRTCDAQWCTGGASSNSCTTTTANNMDGYPETAVFCTSRTVQAGVTDTFNASTCACN